MMKKRLLKLFVAGLLIVSTLVGCGSSTSTTEETVTETTEVNLADGFTVAITQDITTFDPGVGSTMTNYWLNLNVSGSLIGSDFGGNYWPALFKTWEMSEDGMTWTVSMRDDVKWHDGTSVTANDVKCSMERYSTDQATIQYSNLGNLTEVEVVDDYNCIFHFNQPFGTFESIMAQTPIFPATQWQEQGTAMFSEGITGFGAWKVSKWNIGSSIEFIRNDEYFDTEQELSNVDKMVWKVMPEDTSRVSAFRAGELDYVSGIPKDQIEAVSALENTTVAYPDLASIYWLGLECGEGRVFNDYYARKAFTHCIDRQLLCDSVIGYCSPAYQYVAKGFLGYDEAYNTEHSQYDLELAKECLAKSGYNGEPIVLISSNATMIKQNELSEAIVGMMQAAGFNASLEILDNAAFREKRAAGEYDAALSGYVMSYEDTMFLNYHVVLQVGHYEFVPEGNMFDMVQNAVTALERKDRDTYLHDAYGEVLAECAPTVPVIRLQDCIAYNSGYSNFQTYINGDVDFTHLYVSE